MHDVDIRPEIVDRVLARRGRFHLFDKLPLETTALVIIDMQNTFLRPGAPVEVPKGRDIVAGINRLTSRLRALGVPVIWVTHAKVNYIFPRSTRTRLHFIYLIKYVRG